MHWWVNPITKSSKSLLCSCWQIVDQHCKSINFQSMFQFNLKIYNELTK